MTRVRFRTVGAALLGAAVGACGDAPSAPRAAAAPAAAPDRALVGSLVSGLTGTLTSVNGLLWAVPATQASVAKTIGPAGGTLSLGSGLTMVVPAGAVAGNVAFSITRVPGTIVAYDFQPHGTKFAVPVQLRISTAGTLAKLLPGSARLEGAYFLDGSRLSHASGTASVSEFRPVTLSGDRSTLSYTVDHFSGWMVSTGRR
ncbi:hypothetical protein [Roseisolibacter sp. H3M3-2]|uniref:hypothetical protein n=1 Tax=Roseisolibacter sp. H3M3-2 TaxID=3031323 RepID=UPI0023DCC05C|nr:hypothetical protein [Roseisolibacter sp. H3M3-2]MDF1503706.1 hypothetical protein [Roseisolibacter sp. H3M3-2]